MRAGLRVLMAITGLPFNREATFLMRCRGLPQGDSGYLRDRWASCLGVGTMPGGDTFEADHEQWKSENSAVALGPGRRHRPRAQRRHDTTRHEADVEVITIEVYERGRGGGSHRMPAPLERDAAF